MSIERHSQSIEALAQFLVADQSLSDTLHRVAALAQEAVPAVAAVGITLLGRTWLPHDCGGDQRHRPRGGRGAVPRR